MLGYCSECGAEVDNITVCPVCRMKLCEYCLDTHRDDHDRDDTESASLAKDEEDED